MEFMIMVDFYIDYNFFLNLKKYIELMELCFGMGFYSFSQWKLNGGYEIVNIILKKIN